MQRVSSNLSWIARSQQCAQFREILLAQRGEPKLVFCVVGLNEVVGDLVGESEVPEKMGKVNESRVREWTTCQEMKAFDNIPALTCSSSKRELVSITFTQMADAYATPRKTSGCRIS